MSVGEMSDEALLEGLRRRWKFLCCLAVVDAIIGIADAVASQGDLRTSAVIFGFSVCLFCILAGMVKKWENLVASGKVTESQRETMAAVIDQTCYFELFVKTKPVKDEQ